MKSLILATIVIIAVSGCSTVMGGLGLAAGKGREANDIALNAALFTVCYGASVGSIQRRFNTSELEKSRSTICNEITINLNNKKDKVDDNESTN